MLLEEEIIQTLCDVQKSNLSHISLCIQELLLGEQLYILFLLSYQRPPLRRLSHTPSHLVDALEQDGTRTSHMTDMVLWLKEQCVIAGTTSETLH